MAYSTHSIVVGINGLYPGVKKYMLSIEIQTMRRSHPSFGVQPGPIDTYLLAK